MTASHFIELLLSTDLAARNSAARYSTLTAHEQFRNALIDLANSLRRTYRGVHRNLTAVVPVTRDDDADGYVVLHAARYGINGIDYYDDAAGFAPSIDRAALSVASVLVYDYTDKLDLRQHSGVIGICRHLLHAGEGERELATMVLTDYLVEYGYATDGE